MTEDEKGYGNIFQGEHIYNVQVLAFTQSLV